MLAVRVRRRANLEFADQSLKVERLLAVRWPFRQTAWKATPAPADQSLFHLRFVFHLRHPHLNW